MTFNDARHKYFTAHIRNSGGRADTLSYLEAIEQFSLLRGPAVPFETWIEIMGYEIEDTDAKTNDQVIEALKKSKAEFIKVEETQDEPSDEEV